MGLATQGADNNAVPGTQKAASYFEHAIANPAGGNWGVMVTNYQNFYDWVEPDTTARDMFHLTGWAKTSNVATAGPNVRGFYVVMRWVDI